MMSTSTIPVQTGSPQKHHLHLWQQQGESTVIEECINTCAANDGLQERLSTSVLPDGVVNICEWSFFGVEIRTMTAEFSKPTVLRIQESLPRVVVHVALHEHSHATFHGLQDAIDYSPDEFTMMFLPSVSGEVYYKPCKQIHSCEVRFTPEYFAQLIPAESPILHRFRSSMERGEATLVREHNFVLPASIKAIVRDIAAAHLRKGNSADSQERRGCLQRLYLEAKVLELFVLQSEHIQAAESLYEPCIPCGLCHRPALVERSERERLQEAFDIMRSSFVQPPTLPELARRVGLNEFKLKRGFKEIFGTTVYGVVVTERMNKARELLSGGDAQSCMSIAEIAETIGYEHATHFTAAFKKHFGMLPREYRR